MIKRPMVTTMFISKSFSWSDGGRLSESWSQALYWTLYISGSWSLSYFLSKIIYPFPVLTK